MANYSAVFTGKYWFGVRIPTWLLVYDCRGDMVRTDTGKLLMGSEKASWELGLDSESGRYATTPLSCQTYRDSNACDFSELHRQAVAMVKAATDKRKDYLDALTNPGEDRGHGGSGYDKPVAVALCNYGWDVICDRRETATKFFQ